MELEKAAGRLAHPFILGLKRRALDRVGGLPARRTASSTGFPGHDPGPGLSRGGGGGLWGLSPRGAFLGRGLPPPWGPLPRPGRRALRRARPGGLGPGGLLALRGKTLWDRPRLRPLGRYLAFLALLLALFALRSLPHPGGDLPLLLTLFHAGAFLVAYLALSVGVGAGAMCALQDLRLRLAPERAVAAAPFGA